MPGCWEQGRTLVCKNGSEKWWGKNAFVSHVRVCWFCICRSFEIYLIAVTETHVKTENLYGSDAHLNIHRWSLFDFLNPCFDRFNKSNHPIKAFMPHRAIRQRVSDPQLAICYLAINSHWRQLAQWQAIWTIHYWHSIFIDYIRFVTPNDQCVKCSHDFSAKSKIENMEIN